MTLHHSRSAPNLHHAAAVDVATSDDEVVASNHMVDMDHQPTMIDPPAATRRYTDVQSRAAQLSFQQRFELFHRQLTSGCGQRQPPCRHKLCRSSAGDSDQQPLAPSARLRSSALFPSTPNAAYAMALQLASRRPLRHQMICPHLLAEALSTPTPASPSISLFATAYPSMATTNSSTATAVKVPPLRVDPSVTCPHPLAQSPLTPTAASARKDATSRLTAGGLSMWQRAKSVLDLPSLFSASVSLRALPPEDATQSLPRPRSQLDAAAAGSDDMQMLMNMNNNNSTTALLFDDHLTPASTPPGSRSISRSQSRESLLAQSAAGSTSSLLSLSNSRENLQLPASTTLADFQLAAAGDGADDSNNDDGVDDGESLRRLVRHTFSTHRQLCKSFLHSSFDSSAENSINSTDLGTDPQLHTIFGVDMGQVRSVYELLAGRMADDEQLRDVFANAFEIALARLEASVRSWRLSDAGESKVTVKSTRAAAMSPELLAKQLRQVVILFEAPILADENFYDTLTRRFIGLLCSLRRPVKALLVRHLALGYSQTDQSVFARLVSTVKSFLHARFQVKPAMGDAAVAAVRALSLLFSVNEVSAMYRQHVDITSTVPGVANTRKIVSHTLFYCTLDEADNSDSGLHSLLLFKDEYPRWLAIQRQPELMSTTFSYLNYPFLFDPIAKARVLRVESLARMSAWFESAFVHHAFVATAKKVTGGFSGALRWNNADAESTASGAEVEDGGDEGGAVPSGGAVDRVEKAFRNIVSPYLVLEIRRDHFVEDTLDQLEMKRHDLHKPLKIKFVSMGEEGLDQGGVQTEFFQLILQKLLDPLYDLFVYEPESRLSWVNGFSLENLRFFKLFGTILGLAVYNGVMVDVKLPDVFFKKLLLPDSSQSGDESSSGPFGATHWQPGGTELDDIVQLYPALYKGLRLLLSWRENRDGGTVEDVFCRNFEISYRVYDEVKTIPLVAGGDNLPVTAQNLHVYVRLYVQHLLDQSVAKQFRAIHAGFWRVIGPISDTSSSSSAPESSPFSSSLSKSASSSRLASTAASTSNSVPLPGRRGAASRSAAEEKATPCYAVRLFRPDELRLLLTGLSADTDASLYSANSFKALKAAVTYEDFTQHSSAIVHFWSVVLDDFTDEQRRKLLWFVTSSDRVPLGGFKELTFCIQRNGGDSNRLPTALTCFGRLLLPDYAGREKMRDMLGMAVQESQGFGLL